jgi:amidase
VVTFPEYEQYDALGLAGLVRRGRISPEELLRAAMERLEARNPQVNAVVMVLDDHARQAIAAGLPEGPFRGVPYLLKDLTASLAGTPTKRGSRLFADSPPAVADSEHVKRLKRAGLVIFGRTSSCELGLSLSCEPRLYGPTRSPWDRNRISGGSSGGAAAAVGARMVPMAHGGDAFGSLRVPAACCGLVGLKPSRGRGTYAPFAGEGLGGCATEFGVTLSVRDCAALLDATAGPNPGDPYVAPPPPRPYLEEVGSLSRALRVAVTRRAPNGAPVDADHLRALAEAASLCAELGHHVEEADPEIDGEEAVPAFLTIAAVHAALSLASHPTAKRQPRPDEVERVTWGFAERGRAIPGTDYVHAIQTAHRLGRQMAAFHARYEVLLTPALGMLPPRLGWIDMMLDDVDEYWRRVFAFSPFTVCFNLTGQPAMVLPLGFTKSGFPVCVQAAARFGDEGTLFQLAGQLEAARPWFARRAPLAA